MYGFSLFICLPDGMASAPSAGTGTVMRRPLLHRLRPAGRVRRGHRAAHRRLRFLPVLPPVLTPATTGPDLRLTVTRAGTGRFPPDRAGPTLGSAARGGDPGRPRSGPRSSSRRAPTPRSSNRSTVRRPWSVRRTRWVRRSAGSGTRSISPSSCRPSSRPTIRLAGSPSARLRSRCDGSDPSLTAHSTAYARGWMPNGSSRARKALIVCWPTAARRNPRGRWSMASSSTLP